MKNIGAVYIGLSLVTAAALYAPHAAIAAVKRCPDGSYSDSCQIKAKDGVTYTAVAKQKDGKTTTYTGSATGTKHGSRDEDKRLNRMRELIRQSR